MSGTIFSIYCPALKLDVILFRQTWEEHILPYHKEMTNKISLVKSAVQSASENNIYQKIETPEKIAIQKRCSDFLPNDAFIRVAIKILNNKKAVITSAYPSKGFPKKGVKKYEPY